MRSTSALPRIGVVIVTYNAADVIADCVRSVLGQRGVELFITLCDNGSADRTVQTVRDAAGDSAVERKHGDTATLSTGLTLVRSAENRGFAAGVNAGLRLLREVPDLDLFWILNPDCVAGEDAAAAYLAAAGPKTGLIGGRTVYADPAGLIQSDGGRVNWWTGVCHNVNQGKPAPAAKPADDGLDFVSGANFAVTRAFLDQAGLMPERYFLYYEEVDWAQHRGGLSLQTCSGAVVRHVGGSAIGSGSTRKAPSALSNYFNYRNRLRFMRRYRPLALPVCWGYGMLRAGKHILMGEGAPGIAAMRGLCGLPLPATDRQRLGPCNRV
ncbi:MAG: glycosyltransferase family 2 protein [Pseudomonadota bacterium]